MKDYTTYDFGMVPGWTGYQPSSAGGTWAYTTMHRRHIPTIAGNFSFRWQTVGGFDAEFTKLGGHIDKAIWVPSNAPDLSSYISQIPPQPRRCGSSCPAPRR